MPKFLSNINLEQANDLQFKTAAGVNAGKIEQDGNDLVLTNAVGDVLLGDGNADVYIGDGINNVDILFEQSGNIKADDSATGVTLTLGSANTTLNVYNPQIGNGMNLTSTMTVGPGGTIDFTPDTGAFLTFDGQTILERRSLNGAITFGHDDSIIIAGGDTSGVLNTNIDASVETVYISAEGGLEVLAFPNNDTSWSNRERWVFQNDGKLLFGQAGDTNLYRGSANTLNTDDSFVVGSRLYITTRDTNTTSTTALVMNGTEVEQRTLGSAAFSSTGDFAAASHTHNIWDLTADRSSINIDTAGSDNFWQYRHATQTTDGTHVSSYQYVVSFGDKSAGIQFSHTYGGANNALHFRAGSDNPSSENGANNYKNWRRILTVSDEGSGNGLDADTVDGNHASAFALSSHTHAASDITSGTFADARIALTNITQHTDPKYLRSDADDSFSGKLTGTGTAENLKVGGIRGTTKGSQTGEYIHLYERVHIGGPSGWGAATHGAPSNGLGVWGSIDLGMNGTGVLQMDGTTVLTAARVLQNVTNANWDAAYTYSQVGHLPLAGGTLSGDLTVGGGDIILSGTGRIQGVDTVNIDTDAANKLYVDTAVAGITDNNWYVTDAAFTSGTLSITGNNAAVGASISLDGRYALLSHTHDDRYYTETESDNRFVNVSGDTMTGTLNIGAASTDGAGIHLIYSTTVPEIRIQAGENGASAFSIYNTATSPDSEQFFINNTLSASHLGNARGALKLETSSGVVLTLNGTATTLAGDLTVSGGDIILSGTGRIQGIDTVSANTDAANKLYVDNAVAGVSYTHPTHPGDDINLDTGALTGATVISDLDFNITTDTFGHVTDANATYSTRNLTASDVGATPLDDIRSLGVQAFTGTSTTAGLVSEMESDGAFDSYSSVFKTSWDYAGNFDLTDAGRFTETAGTSWITWTDNSSDSTRGNITALAIAPNTGGSAGKVFIYNDQGSTYNPGWREVWTSASDGSGSGLDADLLDGQQGSYYLAWGNLTGVPSTFTPSAHTLDSHSNVTITSNSSGEILKWNGSAWVNNTLAEAGIAAASHTHDDRYYTETEIGNFFSGTTAITGYSKTNWDAAYNWGNHASAGYAPLASPALTGTPTAPTATSGTNTTQLATTAFVQTAVSNLVDSAPATLDTLNELAAALGDDPNFATTVTNSISAKVSKSGDTMTGALTVPDLTIGSGNRIKFANDDYIRYDDANGVGRFHFDADGGTNNASVQAATFVGALSTTGISGSNYNITGVNQLEINDPGEGILFGGGANNVTLYAIDDSTDNKINFGGASELQVNGSKVFHDTYHPNADTWTTARTITIGSTGKSVNGSVNVSWSLAEIGAQAAGTYNTIIGTDADISYTGATVLSSMTMTDGVIQSHSPRTLTLGDLGYTGDTNANNYIHPTHPGDDIDLDTGALSGATVISDLDFNITTDTLGHVTDANATYSTRNLTASDIGAAASSHTHSASDITSGTLDSARIPSPTNGDWWNNGYVKVLTDGVMEGGKYFDMHATDTATSDYDVRLTASTGSLAISGDLVVSGGDITLSGTGRIQGIDTVSAGTDAVNKDYVDNNFVADADTLWSFDADGAGTTQSVTVGDSVWFEGTNGITFGSGTGPVGFDHQVSASLDTTGVTAGGYTSANITVDAYGRITAASSGGGDITGVTAGTGLSGGGTSATVTLSLDLGELTVGGTLVGTDYLIAENGGVDNRQLISSIPLSIFNNNSGWTSNTGTVTSVAATAGSGISITGSPITTSGTLTITNSDRGSSQAIFKNVAVSGQSTVTAETNNDTLTLATETGLKLLTDALTDTITYSPQMTVMVTSHMDHSTNNSASWYYLPFVGEVESTGTSLASSFVAPFAGYIRSITYSGAGNGTPTSATTIKYQILRNGSVVYGPTSALSIGLGTSSGKSLHTNLNNTNATFTAGQRMSIQIQVPSPLYRAMFSIILQENS